MIDFLAYSSKNKLFSGFLKTALISFTNGGGEAVSDLLNG